MLINTIFYFIITTFSGINHDFHLSKSTLNYDEKTSTIQITLNMFIDDLEDALRLEQIDSLFICTSKENKLAETYIADYINDHLIISTGSNQQVPTWIGKEISDDLMAVWCYLEIPLSDKPSELIIDNTIMVELFDDQKNMTTIMANKKRITDILFDTDKTSSRVDI